MKPFALRLEVPARGLALIVLVASGAPEHAAYARWEDPAAQTTAAPASHLTTADVLASAQRALGWDALLGSNGAVRIQGSARFLGTDATQVMLFDGKSRYVESFDGPLGQSSGTDGTTVWARDWSHTPRVQILGDRARAELQRLFSTGAWTCAGDRLSFADTARRDGDDLVLEFEHADGVLKGTVRIDPATQRARTVEYASDSTPVVWRFERYTDHDGFVFPGRIEYEQGGRTQSFDTRTVERLARVDDAQFAPRVERPRDTRFDASVAAPIEVKVARSGHVLVHPRVNGLDLGWFIFDTGAGTNCISNSVTERLGTEAFGEIAARGIGGTVAAHFWRAKELKLGPVTIDAPVFMGLDLAFLEPHFGVPVGGILGYEFLSRCVAEVDMRDKQIALHDPARYALPASGLWEDLLLYARHPCIRARFEGHEGVFNIDTGAAADTVTFHYQAVVDLALLGERETRAGQAGGVGGLVATKVGKLASFHLGGRDFGAIEASFTLEDKGAFADDYVTGNLGGKMLEPFRMVFDYPGNRVGFVPRE